jgi:nitric oxide reductase large subunit
VGRRWPSVSWATIRDALLLFVGLAGTIHETFFVGGERKVLLAVFAAMMGLSGALRLDQLRRVVGNGRRK